MNSLAALAHRKQSDGWVQLHRVSIAQKQGTAMEAAHVVVLGSRDPTTLIRGRKTEERFL